MSQWVLVNSCRLILNFAQGVENIAAALKGEYAYFIFICIGPSSSYHE